MNIPKNTARILTYPLGVVKEFIDFPLEIAKLETEPSKPSELRHLSAKNNFALPRSCSIIRVAGSAYDEVGIVPMRYIARTETLKEKITMNKSYPKTKKGVVKVTFELPSDVSAKEAVIVGEFNNWDPSAAPMKRKKDGSFSAALNLEAGKEYRYKFYLDGSRWENDPNPEGLVPNIFGTQDSLLTT